MQLVPFDSFDKSEIQEEQQIYDSTVILKDNQINYVLDELGGYAKLMDERTGIQVRLATIFGLLPFLCM